MSADSISLFFKQPFVRPMTRWYYTVTCLLFTIAIFMVDTIAIIALLNGGIGFPLLVGVPYVLEKVFIALSQDQFSFINLFLDILEVRTLIDSITGDLIELSQEMLLHFRIVFRLQFALFGFTFFLLNSPAMVESPQLHINIYLLAIVLCLVLTAQGLYIINSNFRESPEQGLEILSIICLTIQQIALQGAMMLYAIQKDFDIWTLLSIKLTISIVIVLSISSRRFHYFFAENFLSKSIIVLVIVFFSLIIEPGPYYSCGKTKRFFNDKEMNISSQRSFFLVRIGQLIETLIYFVLCTIIPNEYKHFNLLVIVMFALNILLVFTSAITRAIEYFTNSYEYFSEAYVTFPRIADIVENLNDFRSIQIKSILCETNFAFQSFPEAIALQLLESACYTPVPKEGYRILDIERIFRMNNYEVNLDKDVFFDLYCMFLTNAKVIPERRLRFTPEAHLLSHEDKQRAFASLQQRVFKFGVQNLDRLKSWFPFEMEAANLLFSNFSTTVLSIQTFKQKQSPFIALNPQQLVYDLYEDI